VLPIALESTCSFPSLRLFCLVSPFILSTSDRFFPSLGCTALPKLASRYGRPWKTSSLLQTLIISIACDFLRPVYLAYSALFFPCASSCAVRGVRVRAAPSIQPFLRPDRFWHCGILAESLPCLPCREPLKESIFLQFLYLPIFHGTSPWDFRSSLPARPSESTFSVSV